MERTVEEKLEELSPYDFDGSIDNAIKVLQGLKNKYFGKDIRLDVRTSEYSENTVLVVVWRRLENEIERENRLKQEERNKRYRLAEYQRLKKEFENS